MIDSHLGFEIDNTIILFETMLTSAGPDGTITADCNGNYMECTVQPTWDKPTKKWALSYDDSCGRHIFLHENLEEYHINNIISRLTKRFGEPIRC